MQLPQLQMADVVAPSSDKSKGTLYAAINSASSFGVYDNWGRVTGQCFRKIEYSPLSPASSGKLKRWADAREAAMAWLLSECSGAQQAAVHRVRDAEQAAAAAAAEPEQQATPERQAVVQAGPVQTGSVQARPPMLPRWVVARQAAATEQAAKRQTESQAVVRLQRWGRHVGLRQRWRDVVAQVQAQAAEAAERAARTAELRRSQPGKRSAAETGEGAAQ